MTNDMTSEQLRTMLVDATLGQPEMPLDRVTSIRRRHVRRRALQAGVSAAVAAVAVVGSLVGAGALSRSSSAEPLNRPVPSWAVHYDDVRDGSVPQSVLDRAVSLWQQQEGNTLPGSADPIWYVGNRVAGGRFVAIVFEAYGQLVGGWLPVSSLHDAHPGWTFYSATAPRPSYEGVVGFHLKGTPPPAGTADNSRSGDDWALVLGPPDLRKVYVANAARTVPMTKGLAVVSLGQVRPFDGPLQLSAQRSNGNWIGGHVEIPGSADSAVPQFAAPGVLIPTGGSAALDLGTSTGQGPETGATYHDPVLGGQPGADVICEGKGPVVVHVNGKLVGRVPCDGAEHTVHGRMIHAPHGRYYIEIAASNYASWRVHGYLDGVIDGSKLTHCETIGGWTYCPAKK